MSSLASRTARTVPLELHFENKSGNVRIVPFDHDVMAMSVEAAIEACRAFKKQIRFKDQFDQLVERLAEWLGEHSAPVADAYLTVRDSGLLFLVVTKSAGFDVDLENALTELELEIAHDNDYELIQLGVHAIPAAGECTASFVSKKMAVRFVPNAS